MSMTQFAMVEELAFLIKDNLPCKHLILSMEEALVNFLQDDTSTDGILELEPMNPYNRLLLHRLADIFGFAHESVGEGDDRHLILERCPESSIPAILVSDILWQYDDYHSSTSSHQLLRRKETFPALKTNPASLQLSLEEREAAYLAARERIFSADDNEIKQSVSQKPRNVPVVARRMIAHALGHRIDLSNDKTTLLGSIENEKQMEKFNVKETKVHKNSRLEASEGNMSQSSQRLTSSGTKMCGTPAGRCLINDASEGEKVMQKQPAAKQSARVGVQRTGNSGRVACQENIKREHMGAARRMFAHALGLNSTKENPGLMLKCSETKPIDRE
ncbi:hypothetical protein NE237_013892 [Protea cynaroides]|uniref:R3H domain-containing protein n=1 Tax=Protea cynaroides TaxID=273540 RepID=A0A9Q0JYC0_9MAGN|nr:hypothetical protein NE237_013892 [Protea cynaroides]